MTPKLKYTLMWRAHTHTHTIRDTHTQLHNSKKIWLINKHHAVEPVQSRRMGKGIGAESVRATGSFVRLSRDLSLLGGLCVCMCVCACDWQRSTYGNMVKQLC